VFVESFSHTLLQDVLKHFDDEKNFVSMARYPDSKLLGTMFIEQLARYVDPAKVIVNDVSPGMVNTTILFGSGGYLL
jgi:NAD(P)-dependent dehydrogenase (short-subunit alcohol dehydrogenase family)